jgi:hypothetical protein
MVKSNNWQGGAGVLPIFPLNSILFPSSRLALKIFEARYIDMVSDCLKQDSGFVVVPMLSGEEVIRHPGQKRPGLFQVGCYARIVDWNSDAQNQLRLVVEGQHRVKLAEVEQADNGLYMADAVTRPEQDTDPAVSLHHLADLASSLLQHPMLEGLQISLDGQSALQVSSVLAQWLPVEAEQKRKMLAMDSVEQRIRCLDGLIRQLV